MIRVLRYPRMFYAVCTMTIAAALARDACVSVSLDGYASVLLVVTLALLALSLTLMSCRFFVDVRGVGVGFLLRVRRTQWEDIASLGILCCNGKRAYFYGMYRRSTDFLNMLHHAPGCGPWGFVVPVSRRLIAAMGELCPFEINLAHLPMQKREGRLRLQWQHAALSALTMLPAAVVACTTGALMVKEAARATRGDAVFWTTLGALVLFFAAVMLIKRTISTLITCPAFNEKGVCAGLGLYLPWENVRFGYVHRIGRMSGMYLLSQPLDALHGKTPPPVLCLSMPDTTTLLLAYLTYCPNASKGLDF